MSLFQAILAIIFTPKKQKTPPSPTDTTATASADHAATDEHGAQSETQQQKTAEAPKKHRETGFEAFTRFVYIGLVVLATGLTIKHGLFTPFHKVSGFHISLIVIITLATACGMFSWVKRFKPADPHAHHEHGLFDGWLPDVLLGVTIVFGLILIAMITDVNREISVEEYEHNTVHWFIEPMGGSISPVESLSDDGSVFTAKARDLTTQAGENTAHTNWVGIRDKDGIIYGNCQVAVEDANIVGGPVKATFSLTKVRESYTGWQKWINTEGVEDHCNITFKKLAGHP